MIGDGRFDLLVKLCRMTIASRTHALVLLFIAMMQALIQISHGI